VSYGRLNEFIVDNLAQLDVRHISPCTDYAAAAQQLNDGELLIDNADYQDELSYFNVYDNSGNVVLSVEDDWVNDCSPDYFVESESGYMNLAKLLCNLFYDVDRPDTLVLVG